MQYSLLADVDPDLKDLVPGYMHNRRSDLQSAIDALRIGDYPRLQRIGHNLRGTAASYGFSGMTDIGNRMEHAAIDRNNSALQDSIDDLSSYLRLVKITFRGTP